MFKVIIAGGRSFKDYQLLKLECDKILSQKKLTEEIQIVSGGADGADKLGEQYAKQRGYIVKRFEAEWGIYDKAAGPIRNKQMADYADAAIIFWNNFSKGAANMILQCQIKNIPYRVIKYR